VKYLVRARTSRRRWIIQKTQRIVWFHLLHRSLQHGSSTDTFIEKEIEKLRQEAQALKQIKEAMGSDSFPQLLFDKAYKDDITRLRSMDEMWKTRRPPETLDYVTIVKEATEAGVATDEVLKDGQRVWNLQENVVVFKDRSEKRCNGKSSADIAQSRTIEH
jgi:ubiquitin-like 1-activating enzyme E1 B